MFIVLLNYIKPLAEVETWLEEHREFLNRYYASGHFLLSGPRVPRSGGVIICRAETRAEVEAIVEKDPFHREQISHYEIIEFTPLMTAADLAYLKLP